MALQAFSSSLPPAQPSLSNARVHRVVPSSGGQPLASASPFAKASHSAKSQRKNGHDSWGTSAAHSRKVRGLLHPPKIQLAVSLTM